AAARRWWRRGADGSPPPEPEPETKKRSRGRLVGFVMASLVGVGIWLKTRRKGGDTAVAWTPAEPWTPAPTTPEQPAESAEPTVETSSETDDPADAAGESAEGDERVE